MLEVFLKSLIIGYSGALMPGSLLTYTIDKSIKNGAKSGLIISIGHVLLELLVVILVLLGFARYLGSELAKTVIGIGGGVLLVFLGVTMIRDVYLKKINIDFTDNKNGKYGNLLLGGMVISASNPYFAFWWSAVGLGLILEAYNSFGIPGVVVFYIGHIITDISWYSFISVLISKTRSFISLKVYRVIIVVLGVCLVGFGLSFLLSSMSSILKGLQ